MTTKVRKQIYLDRDQELQLKRLALASGLSEAEIIRRALDSRLSEAKVQRPNLTAWLRERDFIRQLISAGPIEGGRTWKREDAYDRNIPH